VATTEAQTFVQLAHPAMRDRLDAETRMNAGVCGQTTVNSGI
jgi:hypothetical protein